MHRPAPKPGPAPALSSSETITLALFAQWQTFESQRAFYRYAENNLRELFPQLPHRTQFNRQARGSYCLMCRFMAHMAALLQVRSEPYEVLDTTAVPVRNSSHGGRDHLAGHSAIGHSGRLGFFDGFQVLIAVSRSGVITGFGFGPGNSKEQHLAEAFLAGRYYGLSRLVSVGTSPHAVSIYLADKGFEGFQWQQHWLEDFRAQVLSPPKKSTRRARWPKALRRQMSGLRQIVETVFARLHGTFALEKVRPHTLSGFWASLAAKAALYNACIWINRSHERPSLAFADLLKW